MFFFRPIRDMKMLLSHLDYTRVGHFQAILEDAGIRCFIKNANASAVMGEVPYLEVWPELWVVNDEEFEPAKAVLSEYETALQSPIPAWRCPACDSPVDRGFGECWNCGAAREH